MSTISDRRTFLGHIAGATAMAGILYGYTNRPGPGLIAMCRELRALNAMDFTPGRWPSEAARSAAIDANDLRYQALMLRAASIPAKTLAEIRARASVLGVEDLHVLAATNDAPEVAMWKALARDLVGSGGLS